MAVPTQSEMFGVVLRVMGDDIDRGWRDVQNDVAREVGLTQEEMRRSHLQKQDRLECIPFVPRRLGQPYFKRHLSDKR